MVLAGIVLYNPDEDRLVENIQAVVGQVDETILIDNNSSNIEKIKKRVNELNYNINIIENSKNNGIAFALNQILDYAIDNNYEWFLTLDQDSVIKESLIKKYKKNENELIAMMTCGIEDRNVGKIHNNIAVEEIEKCITSGAYNNANILKEIGGFDTDMFIDSVDFDICASIIENGYKIIRIPYIGILHEVGNSSKVKIFGRTELLYNHAPFRTYYMSRNGLYIINKHYSLNNLKERLRWIKRMLLIILFQENKIKNIKAIIKGAIDSKKMEKKDEFKKINS